MDGKANRAWEDFLNPDVIRPKLIVASLYIAGYEMLRNLIVDRIKSFYSNGFDANGPRTDPKYDSEVRSKNPSLVYASLQWLKESGAIDDNDMAAFNNVKRLRNELAHEITNLLAKELPADLPARFSDMVNLIDKVEKWWIVNVEIPTNPDFDGKEIEEKTILCGPVIALKLLIDVALGSDEDARYHLNEFRKLKSKDGLIQ
jgi:hypothetical protein